MLVLVAGVLIFNSHAAAKLRGALDDLAARGEPLTYAEAYALISADPPGDDDNLAQVPALRALLASGVGLAAKQRLEREQPGHFDLLDKADSWWGRFAETRAGSLTRTAEDFSQWHPDEQPGHAPAPESHWAWIDHADGPAASFHQMSGFLHPAIHELAADTRHRSRALWEPVSFEPGDLLDPMWQGIHPLDFDAVSDVCRVLRQIAVAALEHGDTELATAAVELQLALMRAIGADQATMYGLLVMELLTHLADGPLYDGLRRQAWDEDQLARLQAGVEASLPMFELQPALRLERIIGLARIQTMKIDRGGAWAFRPANMGERIHLFVWNLLPAGVLDRAALSLIGVYDTGFLRPGAALPEEAPPVEGRRPRWLESVDMVGGVERIRPMWYRVTLSLRVAETRLRLAHAAIALERFHLQHGRYPDEWLELVPDRLAGIPLDPFTGDGLRLLPADPEAGRNRPVIYSLGLNGTDNDGQQAWDESSGEPSDIEPNGDIVWAYPEDEAGRPDPAGSDPGPGGVEVPTGPQDF